MPYLSKNVVATNLANTRQAQERLLLMHDAPHLVEKVYIEPDGTVMCRFEHNLSVPIGTLKPKYGSVLSKKLHVQSWRITGGEPMSGYVDNRGIRLSYFGVNLRFLVMEHEQVREAAPAPTTSSRPELVTA
jgi:hypothetical protein